MDNQLLLSDYVVARAMAAALVLLPALLILLSRRARLPAKLAWILVSQLPWVFAAVYLWVWQTLYDPGQAPAKPLAGAVGWWTYAFPWGVYLLYRATRERFTGEKAELPADQAARGGDKTE